MGWALFAPGYINWLPVRSLACNQFSRTKKLGTSSSSLHRPLYYMHDEIKGPRRTQTIYIFTPYIA